VVSISRNPTVIEGLAVWQHYKPKIKIHTSKLEEAEFLRIYLYMYIIIEFTYLELNKQYINHGKLNWNKESVTYNKNQFLEFAASGFVVSCSVFYSFVLRVFECVLGSFACFVCLHVYTYDFKSIAGVPSGLQLHGHPVLRTTRMCSQLSGRVSGVAASPTKNQKPQVSVRASAPVCQQTQFEPVRPF